MQQQITNTEIKLNDTDEELRIGPDAKPIY